MNTAVIGLGTNLGNRMEMLNQAVWALAHLPHTAVLAASHVYETKPVGYQDQPDFLNAVIQVDTELSPSALLGGCFGIEAAAGRERNGKDGPRCIDLDLLLYGGVRSDTFELMLPHPRILERAFVMVPLQDLYPAGRAPGLYFGPYLREISKEGVTRFVGELQLPGMVSAM